MSTDPHEAHGELTLSLTKVTSDGGRITQSWTICDCTEPQLRAMLGTPHFEGYSTAEQAAALGQATLELGGVQLRGSETSTD